jgi:hypothetical protein
MPSRDLGEELGRASGRTTYRQASKDVTMEPVEGTVAIRPRPGAEGVVTETLRSLSHVEPLESQRLLIVELPQSPQRQAVVQQLQEWAQQGMVEFVTPVLKDEQSQLPQILTDEITVRFKSDASQEQLQTIEQKYGLEVARRNEFVPNQFTLKMKQPVGLETLDVASQVDAEDAVEFAAPNFIARFSR